jgi:hypothetical protein
LARKHAAGRNIFDVIRVARSVHNVNVNKPSTNFVIDTDKLYTKTRGNVEGELFVTSNVLDQLVSF